MVKVAPILALPRSIKKMLAVGVDASLCLIAVWVAFYLRLGEWIVLSGSQWFAVVGSLAIALPVFIVSGLYRAIFRYAGSAAIMAICRACALYGLLYATIFTGIGISGIPRTIGLIQPTLLFLGVCGSRVVARYWLGGHYMWLLRHAKLRRVFIYGAGSAGRELAAALGNSREMRVIGFLDDDVTLQGSVLNGKRIHDPAKLDALVGRLEVDDVLLAIPSATRKRRNEILETLRNASVNVRTLPGLTDLAQGRIQTADLRELEIEDLLGRDAVAPNQILLARNIRDKVVLVTGAGGSIGSELCRQILRNGPTTLLLVEVSEYALYTIHDELSRMAAAMENAAIRIVPLLASVCDSERMTGIIRTWHPATIYHAAAYKHVPLVEHNPVEGVRNNLFGTWVTAEIAAEYGVRDFVLISTDKAVRPTNVMGTSKRLAEMVLQAKAELSTGTRFSMVRFGNVLGSSGSVVPLFREQIKRGGPVTLTHAEITRYFMTIPEAAQLVIQAGAMATGGEVFVLDMGDPIKIIELAQNMIRLSGLTIRDDQNPDGDIEIAVTGLRPGEKLYEELLIGNNPELTTHPRIMKANEKYLSTGELNPKLSVLRAALNKHDVTEVVSMLRHIVPEYQSDLCLVDWLHLEAANS